MGRGSPICERVRKKIVEYFKNNVHQCQIAKEINWALLDARGLRALTHWHDSVIDITKWAQEYLQKPLSINTTCRAICRCQIKLYCAKRKPYVNMVQKRCRVLWAKAHLKWTVSKCKRVLWSDESKFDILVGNHERRVLRAKEEGDLPAYHQCSVQKPASLMVWMVWKVYKGFRATYAPLQMTSISGKALCISTWQCKTTYCSYYHSMAS